MKLSRNVSKAQTIVTDRALSQADKVAQLEKLRAEISAERKSADESGLGGDANLSQDLREIDVALQSLAKIEHPAVKKR